MSKFEFEKDVSEAMTYIKQSASEIEILLHELYKKLKKIDGDIINQCRKIDPIIKLFGDTVDTLAQINAARIHISLLACSVLLNLEKVKDEI